MELILKHTFKNIFSRLGRTFLITLCIFLCSFAACFCIDISISLEKIILSGNMIGSTDLIYEGTAALTDDFESEVPGNVLRILSSYQEYRRRDPSYYEYTELTELDVFAFDSEKGEEMSVLSEPIQLNIGEVVITDRLAYKLELNIGDVLTFYDEFKNPIEFTVVDIHPDGGIFKNGDCLISVESMNILSDGRCYKALIDVEEGRSSTEVMNQLRADHMDATIDNILENDSIRESINSMVQMFAIVFIISLMVVVIITVTISARVVNERMSVVGTLRSLGISQSKTAAILLLENIIYALLGSLPAIIIFALIRNSVVRSLFFSPVASVDVGHVSVKTILIVILVMIGIECACSIKEIIKASRTSLRDIIFDKSDSGYKNSRPATVFGIILAVIALITFWFRHIYLLQALCLVSLVLSAFILYPYMGRFISGILRHAFEKADAPLGRLAAEEARTKKPDIASGRLILVSVAIAIVLFVFGFSNTAVIEHEDVLGDILIESNMGADSYYFDYLKDLEGVKTVEEIHYCKAYSDFQGNRISPLTIAAAEPSTLYDGIPGLPESLGDDEVYIDKNMCSKYGVSLGDEVEIVVDSESYNPYELNLKVTGFLDGSFLYGNVIAISLDNYRAYAGLNPELVIVGLEDNADKEAVLGRIEKYSSNFGVVSSASDYYMKRIMSNNGFNSIIRAIAFMGVGLVLLGVISNQLIGFESRKREFAVLMSVAMSRKQLNRMLLIETFVMSIVPLMLALPLGIMAVIVLFRVLEVMGLYLPLVIKPVSLIVLILELAVAFSLTVIFPYTKLRKMNLAMQLKYE